MGLKQDDPNSGNNVSDLAAVAALTDNVSYGERFVTVKTYAAAFGTTQADGFYTKIKAGFPDWVAEGFGPNGSGIDVCSTETRSKITAAGSTSSTSPLFTPTERDNALSLGVQTVKRYPGVTIGKLQAVRND